jgi:hypothetical protein
MKRDRGRPEAGRPNSICVGGRTIPQDSGPGFDGGSIGEMTRALRRSAIYAQWDKLAVGRRVTLPDIEDIGAHLHDPRWDGWAARIEVKRLSDAPRTADRRWRTTVRVAMPGWFANLYAVYREVWPMDLAQEARAARSAITADHEREAAALRVAGLSIGQVAVRMFGEDPSENELRMVKRWLAPPTSAKKG